jgi:hypothetical protein
MPASHRLGLALVATLGLLVGTATALAAPRALVATPRVAISPSCAGDVVTTRVVVRTPIRARLRVQLLQRRRAGGSFVKTGQMRTFASARGTRTYRFNFDVSALNAVAYRVVVLERRTPPRYRFASSVVPAAACAPGRVVPEAPLTILLSLSLLGTTSLFLLRRKAVTAA